MTQDEIKKMFSEQLQLLAEVSKSCAEARDASGLCCITTAMVELMDSGICITGQPQK